MFYFLILIDVTSFHGQENKAHFTTKCNDSEPVVYQTQNTARKIQKQDREKN